MRLLRLVTHYPLSAVSINPLQISADAKDAGEGEQAAAKIFQLAGMWSSSLLGKIYTFLAFRR